MMPGTGREQVEMTMSTTLPGFRAAHRTDPYTPLAVIGGQQVFHAQGGRAGAIDMRVTDDDGPDDDFDDDEADDDDEEDDRNEVPLTMRAKKPAKAARKATRRAADEDDEDDDGEPDTAPAARTDRARGRTNKRAEDDGDDDGTEDDDEDAADWKPPTRAEFEALQARLTEVSRESGKRRYFGKTMERLGVGEDINQWLIDRGIDPDSGTRLVGDDGDDEDDTDEAFLNSVDGKAPGNGDQTRGRSREEVAIQLRKAQLRGQEVAEQRAKPGMILFAAENAFRQAGWSGSNITLALKLLDVDEINIEYDDTTGWPVVYGLDEQVEKVKDEFPTWFTPPRKAAQDDEDGGPRRPQRRAGGARAVDGGQRRKAPAKPQTWLQQLNARMEGGGR